MIDDSHPINPFTSAKRVPTVLVSYRIEDVIDILPQLSKEEAQAFLAKHGIAIAHAMLETAAGTAQRLAQGEEDEQ